MDPIESMPPIARRDARTLVLGTMPGVASLEAQRYYAHPRNAFWGIMSTTFGFDLELTFPQRYQELRNARVAVWDVLRRCQRQGSLDSNIRDEHPNDFAAFFARHNQIDRVLLNGGYARQLFRRYVQAPDGVEVFALPSTSPANARMRFDEKLAAWQGALLRSV